VSLFVVSSGRDAVGRRRGSAGAAELLRRAARKRFASRSLGSRQGQKWWGTKPPIAQPIPAKPDLRISLETRPRIVRHSPPVGLITRRSQVRILPGFLRLCDLPLHPCNDALLDVGPLCRGACDAATWRRSVPSAGTTSSRVPTPSSSSAPAATEGPRGVLISSLDPPDAGGWRAFCGFDRAPREEAMARHGRPFPLSVAKAVSSASSSRLRRR
jgi:hypothetical protein